MDSVRYDRLREVFMAALKVSPAERAQYLDAACGGDAELRAEVARLLAADEDADSFIPERDLASRAALIAKSVADMAPGANVASPKRIGRYRILGLIGEGGMGVVYEAEQEEPRRTVALKVIHPGMASPKLLDRFRLEAEVLGRLEHPGIARIYEAGTDGGGRPFFAMERIVGRPLLEFADAAKLSTRERLDILARICDAVHHAHQKGIIHRDLKPGNILVDESTPEPRPKILDFGIARATDADIQAVTIQTDVGQFVGTIPYMSPEQAAGDSSRLDIRSDVYSLGVILYELLTGRVPHDVRGKPIHEAVRIIQEEEPGRLSSHDTGLRGDVETIVSKALSKEAERRYGSAAELAADIGRYLADEPISARPVTTLYQLKKFARRNKSLVAGVVIAFLTMLAATAVSLWQAEEARDRAVEALFQAYRASLSAAAAAVRDGDPFAHDKEIESAPEELRNWEWRFWRSRIDRSVAVLEPGAPIAGAAFTADGAKVVLVTEEGELSSWDPLRAERASAVSLDSPSIHSAVFDAATERLAAVAGEELRSIALWEVASGQRLAAIDGLPAPCRSLSMRRDGRWIVGAAIARSAWIWDGESASPRQVGGKASLGSAKLPRIITFVPGVDHVVIGSNHGRMTFFDLHTGAVVRQWDVETPTMTCMKVTADGAISVFGEDMNKVYICDAVREIPLHILRGHRSAPRDVAFARDAGLVASAGDRTVRVWSIDGGEEVAVLTGHAGEVTHVAFAPDNSRILSASLDDGTARLWEVDPSPPEISLLYVEESHPRGIALAPDGGALYAGAWNRRIERWDTTRMERVAAVAIPGQTVTDMALSRDGDVLASVRRDGLVRLWNAASLELRGEVDLSARPAGARDYGELAFGPNGSRLAVVCDHGPVYVLGVPGLDVVVEAVLDGPLAGVAFSPNGRRLAVGDGSEVRLLDAVSLELAATLSGHEGSVRSVAFSPGGAVLASGSDDRTVRLWSSRGGPALRVLEGHWGGVDAVVFSPDGTRLVSGAADGSLLVWDPAAGEPVTQLLGHSALIHGLVFSRDGEILASGSNDGTIRLWDTAPDWRRRVARQRAVASD